MNAPDAIAPLEAEDEIPSLAPRRARTGNKRLVAAALLLISVVAVLAFAATRYWPRKEAPVERTTDVASNTAPRVRFPDPVPVAVPASAAQPVVATPAATNVTRTPSIEVADRPGEAIPVRSTSIAGTAPARRSIRAGDESPFTTGGAGSNARPTTAVGTAPANGLSEAQANLKRYQAQLGDMLTQLQGVANQAAPRPATIGGPALPTVLPPSQVATAHQALFGAMERSATTTVAASALSNRSLTMPKGTTFMCSLKTKVISATSGFVGCQTQRNVFSDDGKVVLAERGSHFDGEYRVVQVRPGVTRVPVLWTRLRTPHGVTVDLDSPATGELGESGLGGHVDNRWTERIGAALMLSLIQDAVQAATRTDHLGEGSTVLLPGTTGTGSKLAEKVLDSTINIPPLIYSNQGSIVGVYVARDVDFSKVYALEPR